LVQLWDDSVKRLVRTNPQQFVQVVLEGAVYKDALSLIEKVAVTDRPVELLGLAEAFAGLVFTDEADKEWLERSFAVHKDNLDDSWVVQEWRAEGEAKGLVKGRIEGEKEGEINGLHQALLAIFQAHFPEIDVKMKIDSIQDTELLKDLIVKISFAQTEGEALAILFRTNKGQGSSSSKKDKSV